MFSRASSSILRVAASRSSVKSAPTCYGRLFSSSIESSPEASAAWKKSCYHEIDFTISDECTVYEAVQKFSAFDIGALITVDDKGDISGVVSERDYVNKIALLGRNSKETKIKEISTKSANLVTASPKDTVDVCMNKILQKDIRHLPLIDETGKVVGMLSVKDLIKEIVSVKEKQIEVLSNFALGKGGHFGGE
mmetsp:Transcript_11646/g.13261  ORF Transcript_11646/g.13261 Transcript_11646/m.13261 type:complete len:193 (-) Transcript_11646:191-769(-)|eukprot:CAMPEP_0171322036 /NCGR_PEP_ID=MMETSP0816-20121228/114709_1 /TAXON_ID=420281 /ORGANISM="Proboscia inermis, Strain CCAP1064/1" /LENGTH=192 /DNA_ID=CAMNT_0011820415 /DNA_START=735 /DNA_END=1313 /DNA_ORIENTATION=-